jgi:hypothetical protein
VPEDPLQQDPTDRGDHRSTPFIVADVGFSSPRYVARQVALLVSLPRPSGLSDLALTNPHNATGQRRQVRIHGHLFSRRNVDPSPDTLGRIVVPRSLKFCGELLSRH